MADLIEAASYLETLTGDANAHVTMQTFDDSKTKRKELARVLHGSLEELAAELGRLNDDGAGVFVCVNVTDLKGRSASNIVGLRALFVDMDGAAIPADLPVPPPSIVVNSGGPGRQHLYWALVPGQPIEAFEPAQRRLIATFGSDPVVKDLPRVMRVPGFTHHKGEPRPVTIDEIHDDRYYSIQDVVGRLPELTTEQPPRRPQFAPTTDTSERARKYLERVPPAIEGCGGDHHTYRVACVLVNDFALDEGAALSLIRDWNQTCSPPWSEAELVAKLASAKKYAKKPMGVKLNESRPPRSQQSPPDEELPPIESYAADVEAEAGAGPDIKPATEGAAGDFDVFAFASRLQRATFGATATSDSDLAIHFLRQVEEVTGQFPVVTRGSVYTYSARLGTWSEIGNDQLRGLAHQYNGCLMAKPDGTMGRLAISSHRAVGVTRAILCSLQHLDPSFFDHPRDGVAFANGFTTVGVHGIVLEPHAPDNRCLTAQPYDYDPEAKCTEWLRTLDKIFGVRADDELKADMLQEFVGACLAGIATHYAACLVLIGEGANGKSVVAETIAECLFPPGSVTYSSPQSWSGRFSTARLLHSQLNIASEMPDAEIEASDVFKSVVDGGCIEVERKNRDPFSIRPRAGHLFLTNQPPTTRDNSHGFWRRFLMLPFGYDFSKDPDCETKEVVKSRLAKEAGGIMRWGLEGAVRLMQRGGYTKPAAHHDTILEVRLETDSVAAFLDQACEIGEGIWSTSKQVHAAFCEWAKSQYRKPISSNSLGRRLKSCGVARKHDMYGEKYDLTVLAEHDWNAGKSRNLKLVPGGI